MSIDFDTPGTDGDQPDWLTESLGPDEPEGDDGGDGGGSRLFLILAIGLAGLIILGLFAVGGLLFIRRARTAQVAITATPTLIPFDPGENEPTPTTTPTVAPPTATPLVIAPTNTKVVQGDPASGGNGNGVPAGSDNGGGSNGSNGNNNGGNAGGDSPPAAATRAPTAVSTAAPAPATEVPNTGFGGLELGLIALGLVGVLLITRRMRQAS
ncbi:MAG: hypothetical protein AAF629_02170 [Chloroflexota bacterium]